MGHVARHRCSCYALSLLNGRSSPIQVVDMDSMRTIMRYNNYKEDLYAKNNPMYTICSRGDLLDPPMAGGCTDTKVHQYMGCVHSEYVQL